MDIDFSRLDEYLDESGVDGYLIHADSTESDQYYLSGFNAPDPFVTLYDGEVRMLPRGLEYARAKKESRATTLYRSSDFDQQEKVTEYGPREARIRVIGEMLEKHDVESVAVPPQFPLQTADGLRKLDIEVTADDDGIIGELRATKTDEEIEHLRKAQHANEAAMARAQQLIDEADVNEAGELVHDGELLTSERVTQEIEITLLRNGCSLDETIVACGADAADPHDRGSGPLRAGETIIIDIFPQHKETKYHADMTRTFCHGEPDETVREWYDLTQKAKQAAMEQVEAGVDSSEVHAAACEVYEEAGQPTLRKEPDTDTGFIHSTGHGLGLDVHEQPSVSRHGQELKPGHVITIEPGLYDPEVGGVRIEDFVVVTEDGYENLVDYEESLVVGN